MTEAEGAKPGEPRWGLIAALTIAACTVPWLLTLRNGFVFDDYTYVVANPWIRKWANLPRLLFSMDGNSYSADVPLWRPLRNLHYLIDYTIAGSKPAWYHAMNVLWHGLAAGGLFVLLKRLGVLPIGVVAACLCFGLHPVQAESVAWVKERDGVMSTAFLFWGLVLTLGRDGRTAAGAIACLAAALLSKENSVVFLPIAIVALWVDGRWPFSRRDMLLLSASFLLTILFLVARHLVMGKTSHGVPPMGGTMAATIWGMGAIFLRYLVLVVLPLNMELYYHHLRPQEETLLAALGYLSMFSLLLAGLWLAWKRHLAGFGILFFLIALFPYSNLVPMMQWMAVRFLYVSMAGAAVLVGIAVARMERGAATRLARPLVAVFGLVLMACAVERSLAWHSQLTLWQDAYLSNPDNRLHAIGYADALVLENRFEEAAAVLPPVDRRPDAPKSLNDVAWKVHLMILNHRGELEQASRDAELAVKHFPKASELKNIQAFLLVRQGKLAEAIAVWEDMLAKDPLHISGRRNLAKAYQDIGRTEDAARQQELLQRMNTVPRSEWLAMIREATAVPAEQ